jgi:hypothetical protein
MCSSTTDRPGSCCQLQGGAQLRADGGPPATRQLEDKRPVLVAGGVDVRVRVGSDRAETHLVTFSPGGRLRL